MENLKECKQEMEWGKVEENRGKTRVGWYVWGLSPGNENDSRDERYKE